MPLIWAALVLCGISCLTAGIVYWLCGYTMRGSPIQARSKACKMCSGGVQALVDGKWGPIPDRWKIEQHDGYGFGTFEAPLANKRTCINCNGLGFTWIDFKAPMDFHFRR